MNKIPYLIALYIRLSTEDEKVGSMSIENQKYALYQYVDTAEDLVNAEVQEFVDNGFSGTNFERPAVQRLLDLVQKGSINCVIVKDFSRFGRNSVEVEYYLERVFPLYNVRFIAINDGYDSVQLNGDTGGINVAFRYLINELYSRDLSVKYKSAKYAKFRRGEYQSRVCPYGYKKGLNGRMETDEEAAKNVRLIFELARNGLGAKQIVKALYERRIPTPAEYKAAHAYTGHDISRCNGIWQESTVVRILEDERYTGTYVIGKREVTEVGGHRVRLKSEDEWIKIPDHHPAIVSRELFEQVQAQLVHPKCPKKVDHIYPLKHKVFCGCCRHALSRTSNKNHAYICRHSQADETSACHGLRIGESELEDIVYRQLVSRAQNAPGPDRIESLTPEQGSLDANIAACQERKRTLYEQFALNEISIEEYKSQKAPLDRELEQLRQTRSLIEGQTARKAMAENRNKLSQQILETGRLTVGLADKLIDQVEVYPAGRVVVSWKSPDTS